MSTKVLENKNKTRSQDGAFFLSGERKLRTLNHGNPPPPPSSPPPIVPLPFSLTPPPFSTKVMKQTSEFCVSNCMQQELGIEVEDAPVAGAAEAMAQTALNCFGGNPVRAVGFLTASMDYLQRQYDDMLARWVSGRAAWIADGFSEKSYRMKPGYPRAKMKAMEDARRIVQQAVANG